MDLVEIGWTGKPHGLRGEIKLRVQEFYEDDLLAAQSVLIGDPAVPYFVEQIRAGGAVIAKFETLDSREAVAPLSGRPVWLLTSQVSEVEPEGQDTPWDAVIGFSIRAEGYPELGPIDGIVDLPEHYLAELTHGGKDILIPLHENLVTDVKADDRLLIMDLPQGLLDLD